MFLYFHLLILWLPYTLPVITYPLLYQTACLVRFLLSQLKSFFIKKTLFRQQTQLFPQELMGKFSSTGMNFDLHNRRSKLVASLIEFIGFLPLKALEIVLEY